MTANQLITQALRDLSELRPGATASSADVMPEGLVELNQFLDQLNQEREFVYKTDKTILLAFADGTTDYSLAVGYAKLLRKNLAVRLMPMMKIYIQVRGVEPALEQLVAEAAALRESMRGLGVA